MKYLMMGTLSLLIFRFDDSRGDYYLTKRDHIGYRFEILSLLGKGSFGQVVKCFDHKKQINVAVKMIRNKKRFEKQGLVEVKILKNLKEMVINIAPTTTSGASCLSEARCMLFFSFFFFFHKLSLY